MKFYYNFLLPSSSAICDISQSVLNVMGYFSDRIPDILNDAINGDVSLRLSNDYISSEPPDDYLSAFFSNISTQIKVYKCGKKVNIKVEKTREYSYDSVMRRAAAGLPTLLEEYFTDIELTDKDREVLTAVYNGDFSLIEADAQQKRAVWLQDKFVKNFSDMFENQTIKRKSDLELQLSSQVDEIRAYESNLSKLYTAKRKIEQEIFALTVQPKDDKVGKTIMETLKSVNAVPLGTTSAGEIIVRFNSYLTNYSRSDAKSVITNNRAGIWDRLNKKYKTAMTRIFVDGKYRMICYADLKIGSSNIHAYGDRTTPYIPEIGIQNPHVQYHNCLGTASQIFAKLYGEGDYEQLIYQCASAAGSINWMENITANPFCGNLQLCKDKKIFRDSSGKFYSLDEIYELEKE